MEQLWKALCLVLLAVVLCVLLRQYHGVTALLLSMAAGVAVLSLSVRFFEPILEVARELRRLSGLSDAVTAPLMKIAGMAILTQCAGGICDDAGEKALARTVQVAGSACAVYLSLPLLRAVLQLLRELLGG